MGAPSDASAPLLDASHPTGAYPPAPISGGVPATFPPPSGDAPMAYPPPPPPGAYSFPPPGQTVPGYGAAPPYGSGPALGVPSGYGTAPPPPGAPQVTVFMSGPTPVGAFSKSPFPGIKIKPPRVRPRPGQVIIGYEAMRAESGLFKCDTLNPCGWFFVGMWIIVFFPLFWLPCVLPGMHEMVQHPVYGDPSQV